MPVHPAQVLLERLSFRRQQLPTFDAPPQETNVLKLKRWLLQNASRESMLMIRSSLGFMAFSQRHL